MAGLTFRALSDANRSRVLEYHPDGIGVWSPSEWAVAVTGEVGELCSVIRRMNDVDRGVKSARDPGSIDCLTIRAAEELGDAVVFLDMLAQRLGLDLGHCVARTFNRVSAREGYPHRLEYDEDSTK